MDLFEKMAGHIGRQRATNLFDEATLAGENAGLAGEDECIVFAENRGSLRGYVRVTTWGEVMDAWVVRH